MAEAFRQLTMTAWQRRIWPSGNTGEIGPGGGVSSSANARSGRASWAAGEPSEQARDLRDGYQIMPGSPRQLACNLASSPVTMLRPHKSQPQ